MLFINCHSHTSWHPHFVFVACANLTLDVETVKENSSDDVHGLSHSCVKLYLTAHDQYLDRGYFGPGLMCLNTQYKQFVIMSCAPF